MVQRDWVHGAAGIVRTKQAQQTRMQLGATMALVTVTGVVAGSGGRVDQWGTTRRFD